ncbi:hypothetical protein GW17_00024931 [Ensete ventricosum]|nr:hypothetical protein GW17_00024931 [Ensete ventricosum]
MSYEVFSILRQSVDQGLNPVDLRFSFFLRALYPKEPSLALIEFLKTRFKNIKAGFHRWKSLLWRAGTTAFGRQRLWALCPQTPPLRVGVIPEGVAPTGTAYVGLPIGVVYAGGASMCAAPLRASRGVAPVAWSRAATPTRGLVMGGSSCRGLASILAEFTVKT